jgi:processive 1,2-diacylglycerol beta-glucosyltransferase
LTDSTLGRVINAAVNVAHGSAMHALILSGSLGMGHDVMAQACAVSLEQRGWTTEILDCLRLMGERSGRLGERVFRALLAVPGIYDAFHFEQLRQGGRLARMAEDASARYLVPALDAHLRDRPADLLICVFATGAGAAHRIKARHPTLTTAVLCTDVCPHRLWVHDSTDLYLVTSQTAVGFVRRFHPDACVVVVPPPVRPQFYAAPCQRDARRELGVPEHARCVLLMGGSWGMGPLRELAQQVAAHGVYTLAVAGRNGPLEAALREAHACDHRVIPFGFTDRIPTLMAASDLVITSSGDTCSEARAIGRHLLLLDVVPGHGRENLQHELERRGADVAPSDPQGVLRSALACLERISPGTFATTRSPDGWEASFDEALRLVGLAELRDAEAAR